MMTFAQFQTLVADMRHAQKEYFRTKRSDVLEASKRLEREVDRALAQLKEGQREMFSDETKS